MVIISQMVEQNNLIDFQEKIKERDFQEGVKKAHTRFVLCGLGEEDISNMSLEALAHSFVDLLNS